MPADLDSCVQKVIAQGKTKSEAFAICNESLRNSSQAEVIEDDDKLFLRTFLIDASENRNSWRVSKETLDQNIKTYIGKPLVVQEDFEHPMSNDPNYEHTLQYQNRFRIGNINAIAEKNGIYSAIIEVTDPTAKQAFRNGNLPLYVSPQLYHDGQFHGETDDNMRTWRATHLALVKKPAYGPIKARVEGQCNGDSKTCMAQLKGATCNFCIKRTIENFKSANISNKQNESNSSLEKINLNINSKLSEVKVTESQISQEDFDKLKQALEEQKKENTSLKQSLSEKDNVITGFKQANEELNNRVSSIEKETRTEKIANVLSALKFATDEDRQKRLTTLVESNLSIDHIKETYEPLVSATKSASVETKLPQKSASESTELSSWARLHQIGGSA